MNIWTIGMTIFAGICIIAGIWGWVEERRFRRVRSTLICIHEDHWDAVYSAMPCPGCAWPPETDGVDLTDHDWDLAAKLEVFDKEQDHG